MMLSLFISIIFNCLCLEAASPQENNALCAMASSMPSLNSTFGWKCPTTDACYWNTTLLQGTMECTSEDVTKIYITNIQISGTIPTQIGQLKYLTYLEIFNNQIGGTIPTQIGQLKYLIAIGISYTQLSGTIPTQLSQLTSLQELYLEYNNLSGTIPTQLSQLISLRYLELFNNQINGTIPTQIGQLKYLTWIDISNTQISGTIPTQLSQITNLQTLNLESTQLCGCPHLPPSLTQCNLKGIPHSCNCSILLVCSSNVSPCNDPFKCILDVTPLPIPSIQSIPQPIPNIGSTPLSIPSSIQSTPQPSPYVDSTPLSIPSIESIPQPNPNVGCHGNYGTIFNCKDGIWTSITDIILNGTNLLKNGFNLTILTLVNSSIFVSGDLYINPQSTIVLNTNNNITVNHCAFLDGSLEIITHQSQTLNRLPILNSQCINGTFPYVFVNLTDTSQCNYIVPHLEHDQSSLSVYFDIVNHCNSELSLIFIIIIGIVGGFLLIALVVVAFLISRKFEKREKKIDKLCKISTK